ncbi:hypothetical protein BJ322DRAFT_1070419 [Thelephora terrestris]|uniref:F-box domain-containing protein n=1 Tax=Thelephora terrestris TaxID=56493 RepID=A0A9P6L5S1_9AGAM|nr:hypothetical protein BJ322DRAFT_1070419 [Thelephora terrestris]
MVLEVERQNTVNSTHGEGHGLSLSIPELCFALKTKLAMSTSAPGKMLSIESILSAEEDLLIAITTLRRMSNHHNSITHRLPPEILTEVASHLGHHTSLIPATHICHYWRTTLLSCPRLWSHIEFENEERGLVFLERTKSVPITISLVGNISPSWKVRESLWTVTNRLIALRGMYSLFFSGFLARPLPSLQNLDVLGFIGPLGARPILTLPSVKFLATSDIGCPLVHVPNLTNFRFRLPRYSPFPVRLGDGLLEFFRSCPLLEEVFVSYGKKGVDLEFTTGEALIDAVSLPRLRSFTHDSPVKTIDIGLYNRLSLPPTCDVTFVIKSRRWLLINEPWTRPFPTPGTPSYFHERMGRSLFFAY